MVAVIAIGLLIGYFMSRRFFPLINGLVLTFNFRDENEFGDLYEMCEDEAFYEVFSEAYDNVRSYSDYLLLHQKGREYAFEIFSERYKELSIYFIKIYTLVFVCSAILFQASILYFLLPFIVVHLAYCFHDYYIQKHKLGFTILFLHQMILNDQRVNEHHR